MELEIWSFIDGAFEETFLSDIGNAVEGLQRGELPVWRTFDEDAPACVLRWLRNDESHRVSMEVFGLDLARNDDDASASNENYRSRCWARSHAALAHLQ